MFYPKLQIDDREHVAVHELIWTRTINEIDRLVLRVPRHSVPIDVPPSTLTLVINEKDKEPSISWDYLSKLPCEENGGSLLRGQVIDSKLKDILDPRENSTRFFQVPEENSWDAFFSRVLGEDHYILPEEVKNDLTKSLPLPTVYIQPAGCTTLAFLNLLFSQIRFQIPSVLGWHVATIAGKGHGIQMDIASPERPNIPEVWENNLTGICELDFGQQAFIFTRTVQGEENIKSFKNCIQKNLDHPDLIPAVNVYNYGGKILNFHRIQAVYSSGANTLRLEWELRESSFTTFPPQQTVMLKGKLSNIRETDSCWKKTKEGDFLWNVTLDNGLGSLFAYPRLQFPGNRGVYVPPKEGDKVLLTITHGGFPVADILTAKPEKNFEKPTVSVIGDSIVVKGTESVDVNAKGTSVVLRDDVSINNGKLKVEK